MADRAASIMERHNPVDVARRAAEWRAEGWVPTTTGEHVTADERPMMEGRRTDDTHFEEAQEELKVGKREVDAGGARVERRVVEEPVEEDVTLRQERVNVERRPVDRPASGEDLEAFKEGSVEFRERHEEPVVQKEARVTEEIDVGKTVEERTETIRDTLRRVEVDVESLGHEGDRAFDAMDSSFRRHYDMNLGDSGYGYEYYRPAYQYGYDLARSGRYREYDWNGIESQARQQWEARNPNTWDRVRDAVRQGWQESREGTIQRQY